VLHNGLVSRHCLQQLRQDLEVKGYLLHGCTVGWWKREGGGGGRGGGQRGVRWYRNEQQQRLEGGLNRSGRSMGCSASNS